MPCVRGVLSFVAQHRPLRDAGPPGSRKPSFSPRHSLWLRATVSTNSMFSCGAFSSRGDDLQGERRSDSSAFGNLVIRSGDATGGGTLSAWWDTARRGRGRERRGGAWTHGQLRTAVLETSLTTLHRGLSEPAVPSCPSVHGTDHDGRLSTRTASGSRRTAPPPSPPPRAAPARPAGRTAWSSWGSRDLRAPTRPRDPRPGPEAC